MDTTMRVLAATAAAAAGLLLAGCDTTETEEPTDGPAETQVPENDIQESEIGGEPGDMGPSPDAEDMVPEPDPADEAMDAGTEP